MDFIWLVAVGVLLLVAGLCTLAYDTVRRRQGANPFPFPDRTTAALDETAIQKLIPAPGPVPQGTSSPSSPARRPSRLLAAIKGARATATHRAPRTRMLPTADLLSRMAASVPRRALAMIVAAAAALIVMSVVMLFTGSGEAQRPRSGLVIAVSRFAGPPMSNVEVDPGRSLADYIVRGAQAGGLSTITVRVLDSKPTTPQQVERERDRAGADFLIWGDLGPSGGITAGVVLSPQFAPARAAWQRYHEPDLNLIALPEHSTIHLPPGKGIDPLVPLALGLAYYRLGEYKPAADAAWGAQATLDEGGATGQFARLLEAAARLGDEDYANTIAAVDKIQATGEVPPEALVTRGAARFYMNDFVGALADASGVTNNRDATDILLARAFLLRARSNDRIGDLALALTDLDESARLDPRNIRIRLQRAAVFYRQAQPSAAAKELDALVKGAPDWAPAFRLMGLVRLMLAQPEAALESLSGAERIYNEWIAALRREEAQAQATGDMHGARRATDGIVSLNRELAGVYLYQGMAYVDMARSEPPESFFGGIWRGIRGEPATWERALAKMQEAHRLDARRADILLQTGSLYTQTGQYDKAAESLQQAGALDPGAPEPYMALAQLEESQGKLSEALATLSRLVEHAPRHYPAFETMHRIYTEMGDTASAAASLERALVAPAQNPRDHLWRGKFLKRLSRLDEAEVELRAAAADPEQWEAHLLLGEVLLEKGQSPDALAEFQAVLERRPNDETALLRAGKLLVLAGRHDEAQTLFERLTTVAPGNVDGHIALLELLLSRGEFKRAVQEGKRAVAADGTRSDAHFFLGVAYEAAGDWSSATKEYKEAADRDPGNFQALLSWARALYYEDRYLESIEVADKAIALRAEDHQTYVIKAEAQLALGDVDAALAELGLALNLKPGDAAALIVTARAYGSKGDDASAQDYAQQAIAAGGQNPAGRMALGELHLAYGRPNEALAVFGPIAETADPRTQAQAITGQGRAYSVLGDKARTAAFYADAAKKDPPAAEPHLYSGHLLVELGRWDDALGEYRKAVQLRPNWPTALYYLGRVYLQRKDLGNAQAAFARAVTSKPGMVEAWFGLGISHRDQGRKKEAIDALSTATRLNSGYADAWLYLGLTYEEVGDRAHAAEAFTRVLETAGDGALRQQAEEGLTRVR